MSQYQSFPDAEGASRTFDKLLGLKLPSLEGRSFLDVGCNEGFFCGFAQFDGAARVVGIDKSQLFIERARDRFPGVEFLQQGWEDLPEGRFDVILLASALHYAEDQAELIGRLVERLSNDGILVLELGIATSDKAEWVKVKRGIDERMFPSMRKLHEVLAGYAWKWMGPSVSQDGDPVKRHVLHISRRRPVAYLMMAPPGHGKTSLAKRLFSGSKVKLVSGDHLIGEVAKGRCNAPEALRETIIANYSPFTIDETIQDIFDRGLGHELVSLWLEAAGDGEFAMDMYVPAAHHEAILEALRRAGYLPVAMNWEPVGPRPQPIALAQARAEAFYLSQVGGQAEAEAAAEEGEGGQAGVVGFVDEARILGGRLAIRGWAATRDGAMPSVFTVRVGPREVTIDSYEKQLRPDVQRALGTGHALLGFRAMVVLEEGEASFCPSPANLTVHAVGTDIPLGMSPTVGTEGGA